MGANGRLGYGNQNDIGDNEQPSSAGPVALTQEIAGLTGGGAHTCAIRVDGLVNCWGHGGNGRLGNGMTISIGGGSYPNPGAFPPVSLPGSGHAIQMTAGSNWTCALLSDGQVACWGAGSPYGQLGYGNLNDAGVTLSTLPAVVGTVHILP